MRESEKDLEASNDRKRKQKYFFLSFGKKTFRETYTHTNNQINLKMMVTMRV